MPRPGAEHRSIRKDDSCEGTVSDCRSDRRGAFPASWVVTQPLDPEPMNRICILASPGGLPECSNARLQWIPDGQLPHGSPTAAGGQLTLSECLQSGETKSSEKKLTGVCPSAPSLDLSLCRTCPRRSRDRRARVKSGTDVICTWRNEMVCGCEH